MYFGSGSIFLKMKDEYHPCSYLPPPDAVHVSEDGGDLEQQHHDPQQPAPPAHCRQLLVVAVHEIPGERGDEATHNRAKSSQSR